MSEAAFIKHITKLVTDLEAHPNKHEVVSLATEQLIDALETTYIYKDSIRDILYG